MPGEKSRALDSKEIVAAQKTRGSPSRRKQTRSSNPADPAHSISREGGSQAGS
jgi:hypothetical protein